MREQERGPHQGACSGLWHRGRARCSCRCDLGGRGPIRGLLEGTVQPMPVHVVHLPHILTHCHTCPTLPPHNPTPLPRTDGGNDVGPALA